MARFDFCSSCHNEYYSHGASNDLGFTCACGKSGLCVACANHSICDACGNGCCKDCNFSLPCCGLILCGSGRDVHYGAAGGFSFSQEQQQQHPSCFSQHRTMTTRPCGHYGCNFQQECLSCNPESAPTIIVTQTGGAAAAAKIPPTVVTGPAENLAMYQASKQPAAPPAEQVVTVDQQPRETTTTRPINHKSTAVVLPPTVQQHPTFPQVLHVMVSEMAETHPRVVRWIEDGEAFEVLLPKSAELGAVLLKHFNHSKYSSLQRQLNMYGFKKHTTGKYKGAFQHPCFHRDRSDDLANIRRRPPPNASQKASTTKTPKKVALSSSRRQQHCCSTRNEAMIPQVLSPNRATVKSSEAAASSTGFVKHQFRAAKHLPPKKRFSSTIIYNDSENHGAPRPSPVRQVVRETRQGAVVVGAGKTRPIMSWPSPLRERAPP